MRPSILFIAALLSFAGVANAAMSCCMEVESEIQVKTTDDAPPCHSKKGHGDKGYGSESQEHTKQIQLNTHAECECFGCSQVTIAVIDPQDFSEVHLSVTLIGQARTLSAEPASIFHPPKTALLG